MWVVSNSLNGVTVYALLRDRVAVKNDGNGKYNGCNIAVFY